MKIISGVTSLKIPEEIDLTSSKKYVYINTDIERHHVNGEDVYTYNQIRYEREEYMALQLDKLNKKIDGYVDVDALDINETKKYVLGTIGKACTDTIYAGADITLYNGEVEHFSFSDTDQMNIQSLLGTILNFELSEVAYHADGKNCKIYKDYDFLRIAITCQYTVLAQTTYCNFLNNYIRSLNDKDKILKCYYGMELPEDLVEQMTSVINEQLGGFIKAIKDKFPEFVIPNEFVSNI